MGNNKHSELTANNYYRERYYDAETGRFISEDPIGFDGGDINLYAYVENGPVNWIDPEGLVRKPGKTPPTKWPPLPPNLGGKKPKWNPQGYWDGANGGRHTWDDRCHGAGADRGQGPQGGHWDDEKTGNRWDENGRPLPGNQTSSDPDFTIKIPPLKPEQIVPWLLPFIIPILVF